MIFSSITGQGRYLYATFTISQGNCRVEKRAVFTCLAVVGAGVCS
jgi:hypothetical protein